MNLTLTERSETGAAPGASQPAFSPEGRTILVVDDYPSLGEMTALTLRASGYRVLTASSGESALRLLRTNGDAKIDLLLTDIEMPEMRGEELADWFRAERPPTRILFMSSQLPGHRDADRFDFLQKPFRAEALVSKVREALTHNSALSAEPTAH